MLRTDNPVRSIVYGVAAMVRGGCRERVRFLRTAGVRKVSVCDAAPRVYV